jgi:hypothetical protein
MSFLLLAMLVSIPLKSDTHSGIRVSKGLLRLLIYVPNVYKLNSAKNAWLVESQAFESQQIPESPRGRITYRPDDLLDDLHEFLDAERDVRLLCQLTPDSS